MNLLTMNNYAPMGGSIPGARLAFLHSVHAGEFLFEPKLSQDGLTVTRQWGHRRKPMQWSAAREAGYHVAMLVTKGAFLVQGTDRKYFAPPRTLILMPADSGIHATAARGEHEHLIITWRDDETKGLNRWLETQASDATEPILIHCLQGSEAGSLLAGLISKIELPTKATKLVTMGTLHTLVAMAATEGYSARISDPGRDFPMPLLALIGAVRSNPERDWSLNGAANEAGYSPFHLSRTFKAIAGFGFPEFVDRCRTEIAVEALLSDPATSIDDVAITSGFGSTQAMRDSFREYTGLLPSELRSGPTSVLE